MEIALHMASALPLHEHLPSWLETHKDSFKPPICNKLMHKGQLTIMFVGGGNTRTDFHLEQGSEFFLMLRGGMELPTIQQGRRKLVKIREGEVFLLPSRIPHSPQRPEKASVGLVIERERYDGEMDGLRYYTDFTKCDEVRGHWGRRRGPGRLREGRPGRGGECVVAYVDVCGCLSVVSHRRWRARIGCL